MHTASPEAIIIRRLIVSKGYAANAAPYQARDIATGGTSKEHLRTVVQIYPTANDAAMLPLRLP